MIEWLATIKIAKQGLTADMELKEAASRKADESAPVFGNALTPRTWSGWPLTRASRLVRPWDSRGTGNPRSIANGGNAYPAGNVMTVTGRHAAVEHGHRPPNPDEHRTQQRPHYRRHSHH